MGINPEKNLLEAFKQKQRNKIPVCLDDKVDEILSWYTDTFTKDKKTKVGAFQSPNVLRNFIEKIAVWYELRYPEYEIENLYSEDKTPSTISDMMFNQNSYVNEQFGYTDGIRAADWEVFYNADVFFKSLSPLEKSYFAIPSYGKLLYINPYYRYTCFHLDENGMVTKSEHMGEYSHGIIKDEELEGLHIRRARYLIKQRNVAIPSDNQIDEAIAKVDNASRLGREILNCAMYRIIDRGGNRIGPRRALLFAKEFKLNVDVPMTYGVDDSDPELRMFINEYLKAGGSLDLVCYLNYFSRSQKYEQVDNILLKDIYQNTPHDLISFYTPEEKALHQGLVNVLAFRGEALSRERKK